MTENPTPLTAEQETAFQQHADLLIETLCAEGPEFTTLTETRLDAAMGLSRLRDSLVPFLEAVVSMDLDPLAASTLTGRYVHGYATRIVDEAGAREDEPKPTEPTC